jgi:DNA-binding NarL/FixJ family response regulator
MNKIPPIHCDNQQQQQEMPKQTDGNDFLHSIQKTRKGIVPLNAPVSKRRVKASSAVRRKNSQPTALTNRQTEIIRLIADGYSTRNIAEFLHLSPKTVEKHRQSLMKKLDIHNIAMLTHYAVFSGIVALNCAATGRSQRINYTGKNRSKQGNGNEFAF